MTPNRLIPWSVRPKRNRDSDSFLGGFGNFLKPSDYSHGVFSFLFSLDQHLVRSYSRRIAMGVLDIVPVRDVIRSQMGDLI